MVTRGVEEDEGDESGLTAGQGPQSHLWRLIVYTFVLTFVLVLPHLLTYQPTFQSPFLPHGHQRERLGWPWETEGKVLEWLVGRGVGRRCDGGGEW